VMRELVEASEEPAAYCQIDPADGDGGLVESYASRLGFEPAAGRLYYLVLPDRAPVQQVQKQKETA